MNKLMCTYVLYIHIRYNSSLIFLFTLYHRFHLSAIYILRPMPACFSIYIGPSVCLSLYLCVSLSVRLSVRLWFDWPSVTASRSQLYSICWMYHYIQGVSKLCVFLHEIVNITATSLLRSSDIILRKNWHEKLFIFNIL